MLVERVLVPGHHHPREQQGAAAGYYVHLSRVAAERLDRTAVDAGMDCHEVHALFRMCADYFQEVLCGYLQQILVKVADGVVHGHGAYHRRGAFDKLFAESIGLAVVRQVHDGFCAELYRHIHLLHFHGVVLAVAGNTEVDVDLCFQPGAYALGGERRVAHVSRDSHPALCHQFPEPLGLHVFLRRNGLHFRGDDTLLCGFHLCFVFSHVMSFPGKGGRSDPVVRVPSRY